MSAVSQFVSLDASGTAIIWTTTTATNNKNDKNGAVFDYGLSPWSTVRLVQQRLLRLDASSSPTRSALHISKDISHQIFMYPSANAALGIIPGDTSTVLVASFHGKVNKFVRYDDSTKKKEYSLEHPITGSLIVDIDGDVNCNASDPFDGFGKGESTFCANATCLAASKQFRVSSTGQLSSFVLVGRQDGTIDLFRMDVTEPLQSWDLGMYANRSNTKSQKKYSISNSVVGLQWVIDSNNNNNDLSRPPISFYAADEKGTIYFFDMQRNPSAPVIIDTCEITNIAINNIKISPIRGKGYSVFLAIGDKFSPVGSGGLKIRKLTDSLIYDKDNNTAANISIQNGGWIGRTVSPCIVTKFSEGKS
jgi:hypothetical protein